MLSTLPLNHLTPLSLFRGLPFPSPLSLSLSLSLSLLHSPTSEKMELQAVTARRRLASIAAHFPPPTNYDSVSAASLVPLNCSGSLNSVMRRLDNKVYFARQASSAQSCFMRPASADDQSLQRSIHQDVTPPKCSAARMNALPDASRTPLFSRPAQGLPPQFSRPAKVESVLSPVPANRQKEECKKQYEPDLPKFARTGTGWSPSSDVAECERNYVMTVELPGVNVDDIRVEVDDRNLTVTGRRLAICWKGVAGARDSIFGYHKREILEGPYRVSWALPNNANKDNVCAEFLDGLLRIVIPKL